MRWCVPVLLLMLNSLAPGAPPSFRSAGGPHLPAPIERGGAPSSSDCAEEPAPPRPPRLLRGHQAKIEALCFSPDGRLLASSSRDGTVRLWAVASGALLHAWKATTTRLAFSPDGARLAAAVGKSCVQTWDVASGRAAPPLRFPGAEIGSLCFRKGDGLLALADRRGNQVLLVDPRSGRVTRRLKGDPPTETRRGPDFSADAGIDAACFSADGRILATEHQDSSTDLAGVHFASWIRIWDTNTWRRIQKLDPEVGDRSHLDAMAVAPDHRRLFGITGNGTGASLLSTWDLGTGKTAQTGEFQGACDTLTFAAGGRLIVLGMQDDDAIHAYVVVLEAATGRELRAVATDQVSSASYYDDPSEAREAAGTVAVSPDGQTVATLSPGHAIGLWRMPELLAAPAR